MRIGGVTLGRVKELELSPDANATRATIEVEPQFAPISEDARAILRQKTLLGETYVELTAGSPSGKGSAGAASGGPAAPVSLGAQGGATDAEAAGAAIPEGGHMAPSQVRDQVQIDEIFNALDEETRRSFQRWQANAAVAIQNRGLDLNDSFGNLGPFITDASGLLKVLRRQRAALKGVVRDTGATFEALTEHDEELAGVIRGSNATFGALASEERALAEAFRIFPTFQRETRLTLERLDRFQANARPLIQELIPVARDISPTLRSVRRLAPPLRRFFVDLDTLVDVSERGLPALRDFLEGLAPVLDALDPFLANLNPVVRYLGLYKTTVTDFLAGPSVALSGSLSRVPGQPAARHALRQLTHLSPESLSIYPERLETNRGSGYVETDILNSPRSAVAGMFPSFDCDNAGGERRAGDGGSPEVGLSFAPCIVADDFPAGFGGKRAPNVVADR